jgi:hypothetical protein
MLSVFGKRRADQNPDVHFRLAGAHGQDSVFTVIFLSRYIHNLDHDPGHGEKHLQAANHILQYLKGTFDSVFELILYVSSLWETADRPNSGRFRRGSLPYINA